MMVDAGMGAHVTGDLLSKAVRALSEKMGDKTVSDLARELVETTRCDNKVILFDTHFAGRIGHLFKLLAAIVEVQWKDFFSELTALSAGGLQPTAP